MVLVVIKMGNPTLRQKCQTVALEDIRSDKVQAFIDDLIDTMREKNGAGIAASQVGQLQRIFIMECDHNPRYPHRTDFALTVAINPEIEIIGETKVDSWEGCLSIPGLRGMLPRAETIKFTAYDRHGYRFTRIIEGFEAVVAQHELDHLNGILFVDRMKDMKHLSFEKEYVKYWLNE